MACVDVGGEGLGCCCFAEQYFFQFCFVIFACFYTDPVCGRACMFCVKTFGRVVCIINNSVYI